MDKNFLKKQYTNDFEQLRGMMNEWDPMALISLGCPEDEYDQYTNRVLSILYLYRAKPSKCQDKLNDYLKLFDEDIKGYKRNGNGIKW